MSRTFLLESSVALAIAITSSGCGSGDDAPSTQASKAAMASSLDALEAALGVCLAARESCEANLADATVDGGCKDAFETCRKGSLDRAMPDVARSAKACSEQARTCRANAVDDAAKGACQHTLHACIDDDSAEVAAESQSETGQGHNKADAGPKNDGPHGGDGEHGSPVAACTGALHVCLDGDEPAKICTDALRSCIDTTLANRGQSHGERPDAGKSEAAHGKQGDDANHAVEESEQPDADAGTDVATRGKPEKSERDPSHGKP